MKTYHPRSAASTLVVSCILCLSTTAGAIEPIPEEPGWSGYVFFGVGYTDVKSNTIVGNDIVDVGQDTISSIFQAPESDDTVHPALGLELRYTLRNRSQFFLGSSLEDQLTMDYANQLGWRKQTDSAGSFQIGFLLPDPAIELWEDPYLVGEPRNKVDRDSQGFRFEWDRILGSSFGFLVQARDIEIEPELSGTDPALGCDLAFLALLDRNGDQFVVRLKYRFMLTPNHVLEPEVRFRNEDRDGAAISRDFVAVRLSYAYLGHPWVFVGNLLVGQSEYDQPNPLYGLRQDADTVALDATVLYTLPTESGRWQLTGSVFVGESDSDIEFHDNELTQLAIGFIYNFGGPRRSTK
jgi:hypothetical protein